MSSAIQGPNISAYIDRTRGPLEERDLVALVEERRQHSQRHNQALFSRCKSYYDSFRAIWRGQIPQFRNAVTIPFTFAMIMSDVARKAQTLFGAWPAVDFEGNATEDAAKARQRGVLISSQMRDCRSYAKGADFLLQANICGTAIARLGWRHTERTGIRQEEILPGLSIPMKGKVVHFDGPDWKVKDRLDFFQQPGYTDIEDMLWVIDRDFFDYDNLVEDATSEDPYYDLAAVRRLGEYPMPGSARTDFVERRLAWRSEFETSIRQQEPYGKPVEVIEMHGLVPDRYAPDGIRSRCIAVANGRVVIRNKPLGGNGEKLFTSYSPMPDPYGFDGIGKAEIAYGPQQTIERIVNQKLDAVDLVIDPMFIASSSTNLNTQNLFTRAGRVFLVDGAADDSNIRPLVPNLSGMNLAYQEIAQLYQMMQIGTGETEALMGGLGGSRETARGFLGRQENALTRLGFETALAGDWLEKMADMMVRLNRRYLTTPHEVRILGSTASVSPITGMPLPVQRFTVTDNDLTPDWAARAVGPTQMQGVSARQQNYLALLQVIGTNPAAMNLVNWAAVLRQGFEVFGFRNVEELLNQQIPMFNAMMNAGPGGGASPEGGLPGPQPSNLEPLSPGALNQQAGSLQNTLAGIPGVQ